MNTKSTFFQSFVKHAKMSYTEKAWRWNDQVKRTNEHRENKKSSKHTGPVHERQLQRLRSRLVYG